MDWNGLLNSNRRKPKKDKSQDTSKGRQQIERDFDRILFAAPTRRLADKTQVFPLDKNDSVRTRLTHSHEVANLSRGIGMRLVFELQNEVFKGISANICLQRDVPALLAAIGLVHDLGNPPFGHQGERAMSEWFTKNLPVDSPCYSHKIYEDFRRFDGNSQTLRLVTKLQLLNDDYGLNLTYATLASMIKYPRPSTSSSKLWSKHGYFFSEADVVHDIWEKTGLREGIRHPFTYIMEACDDIAYSVLDAEDIVKKGLASFHDLVDFIQNNNLYKKDSLAKSVVENSKKINAEYAQQALSPSELNDMSMQMFRVYAIAELVNAVVVSFKKNIKEFLSNNCKIKDLMSISHGGNLCKMLKEFDRSRGYQHSSVLKLELEGSNYIKGLMDMLWIGIKGRSTNYKGCDTPFGRYVYGRISENYRRVFEQKNNLPDHYKEAQLLADAISGMTDSYLIALHDELSILYQYECRQR
ncbi:dNTP triphosphohydrolase [Pectobacterium brasiliense]|uniref:deoxyguanosinetriphosphate triphosphohydrolase family protein n=1 Tax=Pectobacterium brasiliense TaxID=180957 RepID=UPI0009B03338|nr:dNTP triphosphohydrolase [Pectobacterium brasiliense]ARA75465.1 deoxyguanosinetriphosphate triphosphohydrolase [Pectobacterium brasiliense]MBN3042509.1 dNTP triphosphohydrolase [Pectobacterium brasiliense]